MTIESELSNLEKKRGGKNCTCEIRMVEFDSSSKFPTCTNSCILAIDIIQFELTFLMLCKTSKKLKEEYYGTPQLAWFQLRQV